MPPIVDPVRPQALIFSWLVFAVLTFGPVGVESLCLCNDPVRAWTRNGTSLDRVGPVLRIHDDGAVSVNRSVVGELDLGARLEDAWQLSPGNRGLVTLDLPAAASMGVVNRLLRACERAGVERYDLVVETTHFWFEP